MRTITWLVLLLAVAATGHEALAAARRGAGAVRRRRASGAVAGRSASRPGRQHARAEGPALAASRQLGVIRHLVAGDKGKFSLRDGKTVIGGLGYSRAGDVVSLEHTVVEPAYRGRGVAKRLVAHAVEWARASGVKLRPACSFAVAEFAKHPEYADVLAP
jgi:predicted GNAT family acetyltransferase